MFFYCIFKREVTSIKKPINKKRNRVYIHFCIAVNRLLMISKHIHIVHRLLSEINLLI